MDNRNISVFIQQIKDLNLGVSQSMLAQCQKDIIKLEERVKARIKNTTTTDECLQEVKKWYTEEQKAKLKSLKDYKETQTDEYLLDLIQIMILGVYGTFGKKIPRTTQLICFWTNIHTQKTILQVKTGEGKTMIVAMTALYYALRGKKVDVFTSSQTLATTQTAKTSSVRKFYELFGITLDENCSIRIDQSEAAKVYEAQIIYGTSFQFQGDYLKKVFSGRIEYFKDRQFNDNHVAILDEVDALLIDKMKDSTRLSSQKPLYQTIKILFVLIYEVKTKLMRAKQRFGGALTITILGQEIKNFNIEAESLGDKTQQDFQEQQLEQIHKIVSYALQNDLKNMFPNYLLQKSGYINHMLKTWIKNSFQSNKYEQDVHYIVTRDRKIVPIDLSTGTYQKNTKWSDGIHQFVELRHGIEPSVDSLVTNYESNLIFFQRYTKYLFGMTGTIARSLGNENKAQKSVFERFLQKSYEVKILKIPTFKKRLLYTEYPKLMINQFEWMSVILKDAKKYSTNRMVLLIFQTIKEAKQFIAAFKEKNPLNGGHHIVELYDHDDYHQTMKKSMDIEKTIIVSTNLGGRGTDYEIKNENILKNGGLFVMMTYFAANWRIEQQAFGRAGRNGQPGSGAFYINVENFFKGERRTVYDNQEDCHINFKKLQEARQKVEKAKFQKAEKAIEIQKQKMKLLEEFKAKYITSNLKKLQQTREIIQREKRIIKNCHSAYISYYQMQMQIGLAEEQWGLFLKQKIGQSPQDSIKIDFQDFVKYYELNKSRDDVNPGILSSTASNILEIENVVRTLNNSCRSYELFKKAQHLNKQWVSKYYLTFFKLKQYQGKIVTSSFYHELNKDLRDIANFMVVDLSVHMAMRNHFNERQDLIPGQQSEAQRQSAQQLQQTENFFIQEISKLQTIAKTLEQYAIKDGKNMLYECSLENSNHGIAKLSTLGFDKVFTVKIYEQPPPKKQPKKGFWASLWDGICSVVKAVVLTAVSVVATVFATVATPLVSAFGGAQQVNNMWKGVGELWKKTGNQVNAVLTNPAFHYLAGIFGTFIATGSPVAAAAWASISYWIFFGGFRTVQSSAIEVNNIEEKARKKSLIEIKGEFQLCQEASKKITQMYDRLKIKKKLINEDLHKKLELLESVRSMKKSEQKTQLLNKFKVEAWSTKKDVMNLTKTEINQIIIQQAKIEQNIEFIVHKKVTLEKYNEKLTNVDQELKKTMKMHVSNAQTQLNNSLKNVVGKVNEKISKQSTQLNSLKPMTQEQIKQLNKKIQAFNKNVADDQQKLPSAQQTIVAQVKKSIAEQKPIDVQSLCSKVQLNLLSQQDLKTSLTNITSPIQQFIEVKEKQKQLSSIWNNDVIFTQILDIETQTLKVPELKQVVQQVQNQVFDQMKTAIIEKKDKTEEELKKQEQTEEGNLIINTLKKSNRNVQKALITPIHNPTQINDFMYYSRVAKDQCLYQKIKAQGFGENLESFKSHLQKLNSENIPESVCVLKGAVFFKIQDKAICKIYEKNDFTVELEKQISEKCTIIHEQSNFTTAGWSIVTDVKKFIHHINAGQSDHANNFGINSSSEAFNKQNVKKQYIASMFLEATQNILQQSHPELLKQREKKGVGSLPLNYLPFQLGPTTQEFQNVSNQILNYIIEQLFKKDSDYQKYKYLTVAAQEKMFNQQKQAINEIYTDYKRYISSSKTKRVR